MLRAWIGGGGRSVVGVLLAWLLARKVTGGRRRMKQRGGHGSTNIQVGGNLNLADRGKEEHD